MSDQQMNEMSSQQPQDVRQPSQAAILPGAMLASARQKKGWSVEQVASLVKLAPRQIQAIEADNYAALPGLAVARGFVRSYAKVLGLDAHALAAAMPQETAVQQRDHIVPQHSLSTPFSEGPLPAMMMSTRGNSSVLPILAGVVVVAVLAGAAAVRWTELGANVPQLAWLKAHHSETSAAPETTEATQGVEVASNDTPVNARVETITPPPAEASATQAAPAPEAPAPVAAQPAPTLAAAPAASEPASTASPAAVAPTSPAASSTSMASTTVPSGLNIVNSKDLLRLTFREDSWVEIRRADKSTIISRLLKAGTTETFDVSDATTLIIGNAAGVDATLRGQPLDLKTPGGSNVARLNLN
ncbi:transmembrane protein [Herbaspirillum rubrisubalbicans M1]|uniref:helix-turn-helix domain-containing protein n=1 Tax=Herbaspirillum rubrisubalbicans TaxID=80842 RepID=UPI00073A349D|nr:helix-turn-helix domain-containing protein [Herbaspirillum rubrisubalbicans]ALU90145.1 transmembrane protein [Herbaspirillum rubrisubalbicans M1]